MGRPDRSAILLELMVENNMVHPSMSDEELLEAVEALERQHQQPECYDGDKFEFSDEFLDRVKLMEERGDREEEEEEEEEEEHVVIQPDAVNPDLLGQEQEKQPMTVQPFEVSFFIVFFSK